jgi:hypothetical protein
MPVRMNSLPTTLNRPAGDSRPEAAGSGLDQQLNRARQALAAGSLSPAESARLRGLLAMAGRALSRGDTTGAQRYADEAEKTAGTTPGETTGGPGRMAGSGGSEKGGEKPEATKPGATDGPGEPEDPERRTYQDRSADPGVSFQEPTPMTQGQAEIMVRYHEGQHYRRDTNQAAASDRKVIYAYTTVQYRTDPATGERYIRGGRTVVKTADDAKPSIDARA